MASQMPARLHSNVWPTFVLFLICLVDLSQAADKYKIQALHRECGSRLREFLSVTNTTCSSAGPVVSDAGAVWEATFLGGIEGIAAIIHLKQSKANLLCKGYLSRVSQKCDNTDVNLYSGTNILANKNLWVMQAPPSRIRPNNRMKNVFYLTRKSDPTVSCSGGTDNVYLSYSNTCSEKALSLIPSDDGPSPSTMFKFTLVGGDSTTKTPSITAGGISPLLLKYTVSAPTFGEPPVYYRVCNNKVNSTCTDCLPECKNIKLTAPFTRSIDTDFALECSTSYQLTAFGIRAIGTATPTASSGVYTSKPCIVDG